MVKAFTIVHKMPRYLLIYYKLSLVERFYNVIESMVISKVKMVGSVFCSSLWGARWIGRLVDNVDLLR